MEIASILAVALGGGIGASCRYLTGKIFPSKGGFPVSTFLVNVVGSAILAFFTCLVVNPPLALFDSVSESSRLLFEQQTSPIFSFRAIFGESELLRLFLMQGFCGALTTFSTFSMETLKLLLSGRICMAFLNIGANVVCSLSAASAVFFLMK